MPSPTQFDPVIQAVARRAEKIYTKMGIRRDESEDLGRKKKGDTDTPSPLWDDITEVSLVALRGFLEDLLGIGHPVPVSPASAPPTASQNAPQTAAAHAAHAYQVTGKAVHDENIGTFAPPPAAPAESPPPAFQLGEDFGEAERDTLRGYIRDLTLLESRGIETLPLQRSLTFLDSIHQAITAAK